MRYLNANQCILPVNARKSFLRNVNAVVLFLFLVSGNVCFGQRPHPFQLKQPEPSYRIMNAENGLPSSETYDIHQDRDGYIWIATDRGVVRYDGYRYKVFTKKDGLADNVIFKLEEDHLGRIWFISYNGLLSYSLNGSIYPYKFNAEIKQFIGGLNPTFKTLRIDRQGNLFYSIQDIGILKITPQGLVTEVHPKSVVGIAILPVEDKWLPSFRFYGRKAGSSLTNSSKKTAGIFTDYPIIYVDTSKSSRFLFRADLTVNMAYSATQAFLQSDNIVINLRTGMPVIKEVSVIGVDCIGDVLFSGIFRGGVRMDDFSSTAKAAHPHYFLKGYSVSSVMKDREGGYWFTTLENGVFYTPDLHVRSYTPAQGLPDPNVLSVAGIGSEVWVTYFGGCLKLAEKSLQYDFVMGKYFPHIAAAANAFFLSYTAPPVPYARVGNIIHTPAHMGYYARNNYVVAGYVRIFRMYDDGREDTLYNSFNYNNTKTVKNPTSFHSFLETASGRVFAGNLDGVFEIRNNRAENSHLKDPLFHERVTSFAYHKQKGAVTATRGKGIFFFNEKNEVTLKIDASDGLLSDQINSLYVDSDGLLYVATSNGLNIVRFTGKRFFISSMTVMQGLCSNEINAVYRYKDSVWIATKLGITLMRTNDINRDSIGTVRLEYLATQNDYYEKERLPSKLPPHTPLIRIGLRTDNFRGSEKHEFQYRLRQNAPWITTSEPEIVISNPDDDDYSIEVKFRDDRGTWSRALHLARFTVETPYYKEWYVILFLSVFLLGLIYVIFRIVLRRIKTRHHYETRINKLEQKALSAQMNPHFIFNSLNSIQSFLIYEENEKAEKYLLTFSSLIRKTLANSREHYIRLEEELTILSNYLELEQMRFRDKFSFTLKFELEPSKTQYFLPPMLIQPYIENAVVHGVAPLESGGKIDITFSLMPENRLLVVIEDNGIGRKKADSVLNSSHRSFGTTITSERLTIFKKQLGGEFRVEIIDKEEDGKPCGTRIELIIPLLKDHERDETN